MNCLKNTDYDTHCIFKIIMQFEAPDSTVDTMTKLKPTIPKNMASILAERQKICLFPKSYPTQAPILRVPAMG